jgi:nucleoside-diphosphate-sugar epimerase/predicted dehydrogenase
MNADPQRPIERPLTPHQNMPVRSEHAAQKNTKREQYRVGVIGTGYIADYHLQVLQSLPHVQVTSALDTNLLRLNEFCDRWSIGRRSTSIEEFLSGSALDVVHILTPPATHAQVTKRVLEAGVSALVEKPFVLSSSECCELESLACERGVVVAVNHNAVYHPAMQRLLSDVRKDKLGPIQHVVSVNNLQLAQLAAGQHDHWMFQRPENILFEQATHPLSQVCELLGDVVKSQVFCTGTRTLKNGKLFCDTWQVGLQCERGTAQLYLSWGKEFPETRLTVIGSDGIAHLDFDANTYAVDQRTKYLPAMDRMLRGGRLGFTQLGQSFGEFAQYVISTLRITGRRDPYYLSMKSCIESFYRHLHDGSDFSGTSERARTIISAIAQTVKANSTIERTLESIDHTSLASNLSPSSLHQDSSKKPVLVIGGTGFIGRHLIKALEKKGERLRVLVRRPDAAKALVGSSSVETVIGDVRDADSIDKAVQGCDVVYLLVSGAPETWKGFEEIFLDGTKAVAEACLKHHVKQLIYTSSITAFDLGDPQDTILETTPLDRFHSKRCHYSRAKILCEMMLQDYVKQRRLPVLVFRPGFVIGEGTSPAHLGVGEWPVPTHCISWGTDIDHPLPFVLVQDVVDAIVLAHGRHDLIGKSFNLVGDVRPTARQYIQILRDEMRRGIRLHQQSLATWAFIDWLKWLVKAVARKPENSRLTYHELAYRSGRSPFDTTDTKNALGWKPESDLENFIENGIRKALKSA